MAGDFAIWTESFKAAGDLSAYQDRFVTLSAANTVTVCGAQGKIVGVLKNAPTAAGQAARVQMLGVCEMDADGDATDIVIGDWIISGALGVAFSGAAAKDCVGGIANAGKTTAAPGKIEVLSTGSFTLNV